MYQVNVQSCVSSSLIGCPDLVTRLGADKGHECRGQDTGQVYVKFNKIITIYSIILSYFLFSIPVFSLSIYVNIRNMSGI